MSGLPQRDFLIDQENSNKMITSKIQKRPSPLFVELEHLEVGGDAHWVEKARWIKLEENVEEGSMRWTTPFIPSFSYEAIANLKYCFEKGDILLNVKQNSLRGIATFIVEKLIELEILSSANATHLHGTLLARHLHQHQKTKGLQMLKKNTKKVAPIVESRPDNETTDVNNNVQSIESQSSRDIDFTPEVAGEQEIRGNSNLERVMAPESEVCTILTAYLPYLTGPCAVLIRLTDRCSLGSISELRMPVRFLAFVGGPANASVDYFESGRCIGALMSDDVFRELAYLAEVKDDILSGIDQFLQDSLVVPPGAWNRKLLQQSVKKLESQSKPRKHQRRETVYLPVHFQGFLKHGDDHDPLERTGKFCGGIINDIKRKAPFYLSDFKEALNWRCFLAIIFVYFASLAPAITFGALLSEHTLGLMGVSEMVLATGLAGIVFGLFAGQPLIIVGATGPLLVMEKNIYDLALTLGVEFLPWRVWIGLWVFLICFVIVALDLSFLVKYFTRFTEEIFAFLVSAIFIYEAISHGFRMYKEYPFAKEIDISGNFTLNKHGSNTISNHPNTGLMSVTLMMLTFVVSYVLRKFRHSQYFPITARRLLSDFGILISVTIVVLIDILMRDKITEKLQIPDGFTTTSSTRGWFISPMGATRELGLSMIFLAILPAFLVSFLVFMETELTGLIMDKKENKLKKGCGYHLDLLVVGAIVVLCSLLGLPLMCASPVHSVSHLNALTVLSNTHAPGTKHQIIAVKEQRLTNIIMHLLIGISVFLAPMLRLIPVSVLFGVFLYLGVISVTHLQLFQRLRMLFIPSKHHPDTTFVRRVTSGRIHLFTVIQLLCLIALVLIKTTIIAPAFPFFILCLIPLRKLLGKLFTEDELESLDNEMEDGDDLDEYESVHVPI